jgi:hypothetical protein
MCRAVMEADDGQLTNQSREVWPTRSSLLCTFVNGNVSNV